MGLPSPIWKWPGSMRTRRAPREFVKSPPVGITSENATRAPVVVITAAAVTEDWRKERRVSFGRDISQPRRLAGGEVVAESIVNTESGSSNADAAIFCCKWATDDVPGIGVIIGERRNSHASAT